MTARPWFDGDVLVCPVGSEDSADWKPALAYPAFKQVLLAPKPPEPAAAPPPPPPPPPPPAPVLEACPHCGSGNLPRARFCCDCGKHMDGTATPPPRAVTPPPRPVERPAAFEAAPAFGVPAGSPAEPSVFEPPSAFAPPSEPERPMARPPERSGPMSRPLQAQGPVEPAFDPAGEHTFESLTSQLPHPIEPSLAPDPTPAAVEAAAPAPAAVPLWKRPPVLAAFVGAAALSAGAAWTLLRPAAPPPAPSGADLNLSAPEASRPMDAASSQPIEPAPVDAFAPTPASASFPSAEPAPSALTPPPSAAPARTPKAAKAKPKPAPRPKRKSRPARPAPAAPEPDAADAILIESRVGAGEPAVPGGEGSAETLSDPDAAPQEFLPGIPRRPGMKPKGAKPAPKAEPGPLAEDAAPEAATSGPAEPSLPVGGAAAAAAAASAANPGDALALQQAVEEFEFCAQLLAQGAYADHFDTCLCKETRERAPYRNRRGYYASALEKEAAAGRLEVRAEVVSTRMENGAARIVARWKAKGNDPGREVDETWVMDDGLWCKAP